MENENVVVQPSVEQKKKSNAPLIILIVLLFIIAVAGSSFGGYMFGKSDCEKTTSNCVTTTVVTEKVLETAEDFNMEEAKKLLAKFKIDIEDNKSSILDANYNDVYKKFRALENVDSSKIIEKECSELYDEKIEPSPEGYDRYNTPLGYCFANEKAKVYPYDEVNKVHNEMFGTDVSKEPIRSCPDVYDFDEKLNGFVLNHNRGCGFEGGPVYTISQIKSAKQIGNKVYIDIYHDHSSMSGNANSDYFIIHLANGTTEIEEVSSFDNAVAEITKIIKEKYIDKLPVYEVEFEKVDDHYQLNRIYIKKSN